jgi:hypothetical protein
MAFFEAAAYFSRAACGAIKVESILSLAETRILSGAAAHSSAVKASAARSKTGNLFIIYR